MIEIIELYLVRTGKHKAYFKLYFLIKYRTQISLLLEHYKNWSVIEEGLHSWDVFRIFLKTYGWNNEVFSNILYICFYVGRLELSDPKTNNMMVRLKRKTSLYDRLPFIKQFIERRTYERTQF